MIIHSPTISGSLTFAEGATTTLPDGGVYSGSFSGSLQVHEVTSHIIPDANEVYDLGSVSNRFRDIYISSGTMKFPGGGMGMNDAGEFTLEDNDGNPTAVVSSGIKISDPISGDIIVLSSQNGQLKTTATNSSGTPIEDPSSELSGSFTGSFLGEIRGTNGIVSSSNQISGYNVFLKLDGDSVISGSSQVVIGQVDGYTAFSASLTSTDVAQDVRITSLESFSSSLDGGFATDAELTAVSSAFDSTISSLETLNIAENTNLYYTDARVKTKLNTEGVISSSAQLEADFLNTLGDGVVSGSSQISFTGITDKPTLVSGSSQVDLTSTTNYISGIKSRLTAEGVISGSSQVTITESQISDLVHYTDSDVKTKLNTEGVISGSSQVTITQSQVSDVTATAAELNILDGVTSTTAELNILDGVTATTAELNYVDGVTSNIQTQLNSKQASGDYVDLSSDQTITGTKTFQDIAVNGTGSFAFIQSVTGSAKIIGDAYIILNADSPAEQYSGIKVYDSGSGDTGSLEYDSANNHWFYESTTEGYASGLIAGPRDSRGAITFPSNNTIVKGIGGNHISNSNITDNGSIITLGSNTTISGGLTVPSITLGDTLITATAAEINKLDGVTASTAELNYVDGVTSNIQTQLNAKLESFDITTQTDSKYLRSNANDTASGIITLSNSTASTSKTTGALVVTGGVGVSGALNVGGDVVAYASSDKRLKDNIQNIENPIEKVQKLNGVTWNWNGNADELQQSLPNVGVIAQEVEEVFPQLVHDRDNGYKGVDYAKLTGLLIEAVKEQQKQIDELKSRLG